MGTTPLNVAPYSRPTKKHEIPLNLLISKQGRADSKLRNATVGIISDEQCTGIPGYSDI